MTEAMSVFDRRIVRQRRDRSARNFSEHSFLFNEINHRLIDRLQDVRRQFPRALNLGCRSGELRDLLSPATGVEFLVQCDLSAEMARLAPSPTVVADEEALPFADESFDLVISCLNLHWVNDLPGTLVQIRRALRPDGLFLAALFGGSTLTELKQCLAEAEIAVEGGLSPRISPFADVRDAGNLLQRAGFSLPIVDVDTVTVTYGTPAKLLGDLRGMGESNAVLERRKTITRRSTLATALSLYRDRYGDAEGRIPATFQVIYLSGWAPHPTQPQPLRPGSAKMSLKDALATVSPPELGGAATPESTGP